MTPRDWLCASCGFLVGSLLGVGAWLLAPLAAFVLWRFLIADRKRGRA